MPITKSAKKALRQSIKRRKMNLQRKKALKNIVVKIKKLKAEGKKTEAEKLISLAYKAIDKAAKRGIIKRGAASRKKSRLIKFLRK
ncbi:MAG: 30S ribosomal protein S20 [Patescibacteria group bacterium]